MNKMEPGEKFAIPKVPKKHVVKTPALKSEPLDWSDLRDPENEKNDDIIKREHRSSKDKVARWP